MRWRQDGGRGGGAVAAGQGAAKVTSSSREPEERQELTHAQKQRLLLSAPFRRGGHRAWGVHLGCPSRRELFSVSLGRCKSDHSGKTKAYA